MSLFDDDDDTFDLFNEDDTKQVDAETEAAITNILLKHDPDGKIASQVCESLVKDSVTLTLLSEFDDISLKEVIDSWDLNTYNQKPFIIRGVLINGIKKLRKTPKRTENVHADNTIKPVLEAVKRTNAKNATKPAEKANIAKATKQTKVKFSITNVKKVSKAEEERKEEHQHRQKLEILEKELLNKINNLEKNEKDNNKIKAKLLTQYKNDVDTIFNQLNEKLNKRREELVKNVKDIFDKNVQVEAKGILDFKEMKSQVRSELDKKNVTKLAASNVSNKVNNLLKNNKNIGVGYECNVLFDNGVIADIEAKIDSLGKIVPVPKNMQEEFETQAQPKGVNVQKVDAQDAQERGETRKEANKKEKEKEENNRGGGKINELESKRMETSSSATNDIKQSKPLKQEKQEKQEKPRKQVKKGATASWISKSKYAVSRALARDGVEEDESDGANDSNDDWMHTSNTTKKTGKPGSPATGAIGTGQDIARAAPANKESKTTFPKVKPPGKRGGNKKKHPPVLKNLW